MRTHPPRLILASTSRYRRALLERLGVPFEVIAPTVDEAAIKADAQAQSITPFHLACGLAALKADSVAERHRDAVVIGSDQVCSLGAQIFSKPGSRERAIEQLRLLAGQTHELHTGLSILGPDGRPGNTGVTDRLTMLPLDDAAIARYVDRDQPFDCAGSYKLEAAGIGLFSRVETADSTSVTGLPLLLIAAVLREFGFAIP